MSTNQPSIVVRAEATVGARRLHATRSAFALRMKQRVESKFQYCKLPCRPRKCRVERPAGDGWLGSCRSLEARPAPAGVGVGVGAGAGRGAGEPEPGAAAAAAMPPAEAAAPARRKKHCSPPRREAETRGPPSRARAGAGAGTWVPFRAVQFSSSTSGAFGRSPARPPPTAPYLTLAASSPLSLHSQLAQLGIAPGPPGRGSTPRVFQWAPASRPAASRWPPLLGVGAGPGAGPGTAPWATPRTSPSATAPATAHTTNCREWAWASRHGLCPWERGGGGGWGWGSGSGERPESPAAALAEALAARGLPAAAASPFPPGTDPALALVLLDEDNLSEVKAEREVQSWVALLPRGGAGAGACKGGGGGGKGGGKGGGGDAAASASGSSSGLSCCGGVLLGRPKARLKRRGRGPVIRYAPSALAPAAPATAPDPAPIPATDDPTPGNNHGAAADGGCSPSQSPPQVDVCCSERRQLFLEISHARVCRPSPAVWPPAPAAAPAPAPAPAPSPSPSTEPAPAPAPAPFTVSQPGHAKRPAKPQRCGPWGGRGRGGGRGRRAARSGAEAEADLLPVEPMLCSAAEF